MNFIPPEVANAMRAEFDVILLSQVLEHVDSCDEVLGSLQRLLAPNGKFGMEIEDYVYINLLPPFVSRTYY